MVRSVEGLIEESSWKGGRRHLSPYERIAAVHNQQFMRRGLRDREQVWEEGLKGSIIELSKAFPTKS